MPPMTPEEKAELSAGLITCESCHGTGETQNKSPQQSKWCTFCQGLGLVCPKCENVNMYCRRCLRKPLRQRLAELRTANKYAADMAAAAARTN